jgi:thiol-disulfide isomerase/thioredoxin
LPADWSSLIEDESLQEVVRTEVERERLPAGTGMPYFYLENMEGEFIEPSRWRGKVVLINFWATWCKPCLKEFPHENKLVKEYAGQPVQIVNICLDSGKEAWQQYSAEFGLNMINLFANETWSQNLKKKFFIQALPHSVLVATDGRILKNHAPRASGGVHRLIDLALGEM